MCDFCGVVAAHIWTRGFKGCKSCIAIMEGIAKKQWEHKTHRLPEWMTFQIVATFIKEKRKINETVVA